jgi:rubrerythrin
MFKLFRCQLCGETYLGEQQPDRCPYCGAAGKLLVAAAEWADEPTPQLDETSRSICQEGLGLELSNTAYYQQCRYKAELPVNVGIFARLSKQEQEHAEAFSRLLGQPLPQLPGETAPESDAEKFAGAHAREQRAIKFYLDGAKRATNQRVKELLRYLAEIEVEHLKVSNTYR